MSTGQLVLRNKLIIGAGQPKICVSIMGENKEEILKAAQVAIKHNPDLLEWRVDYYEQVTELEQVLSLLSDIRTLSAEIPLIFTFRSKIEGGEQEISPTYYSELNIAVSKTGNADLIDIELFHLTAEETTKQIHDNHTKVIMSNHDFQKTPESEEIQLRLQKMDQLGADIAKIAVMPTSDSDVLRLLEVTSQCKTLSFTCPIVTMSMASQGMISRLAGEIYGSAITFASVTTTSAPGQIPIQDLKQILTIIHNNL